MHRFAKVFAATAATGGFMLSAAGVALAADASTDADTSQTEVSVTQTDASTDAGTTQTEASTARSADAHGWGGDHRACKDDCDEHAACPSCGGATVAVTVPCPECLIHHVHKVLCPECLLHALCPERLSGHHQKCEQCQEHGEAKGEHGEAKGEHGEAKGEHGKEGHGAKHAQQARPQLAHTGLEVAGVAPIGAGLMLGGGLLYRRSRRRVTA